MKLLNTLVDFFTAPKSAKKAGPKEPLRVKKAKKPLILRLPAPHGDIDIVLKRGNRRFLRLSVHAPEAQVNLSVPNWVSMEEIQTFLTARTQWLLEHRAAVLQKYPPCAFAHGDTVPVWGESLLLHLEECEAGKSSIHREGQSLVLCLPAVSSPQQRKQCLDKWYIRQVKEAALPLMRHWEGVLQVAQCKLTVRTMKSRWGSCTPSYARIRLNSRLAEKAPECLNYVVLHELAHMLEGGHGPHFYALLDKYMPQWREIKGKLK